MITAFINWYTENNKSKKSNYLKNNFKNDPDFFHQKLEEISQEFYNDYQFDPFNIEIDKISNLDIENIKAKLEIKGDDFNNYNKKFGNGIPKALLGKNNYLAFLNEKIIEKEDKNEQVAPFFLRKEFIKYLIKEEDFSAGSARDYASYVSSSLKYVLNDKLKMNFFETIQNLFDSYDDFKLETLFETAIHLVKKHSDKTKANKYKVGLTEYKYFLYSCITSNYELFEYLPEYLQKRIEEEKTEKTNLKASEENYYGFENIFEWEFIEDKKIIFENDLEQLRSNFNFRMITQDRLYGDVYFPVKLLKKIFFKEKTTKEIFNKFIYNQIDNIKIYNSDDEKFIYLKDIESLKIEENGDVYYTKNNTLYPIFTETAKEGVFTKMNSFALRNIAIDHVVPMKTILIEEKENLPGLLKLTNLLKDKGILKSGKESSKLLNVIGNQIIEEEILSDLDILDLQKDLKFLETKLFLQLMCSKENLGKNTRN